MKNNIILTDEMDHLRLGIFPPFLPTVGQQLLRVRDVADRRVEPDIQDFTLGSLDRHGNAPIQVAADRPGLQAHIQPALALAIDVRFPLLMPLEDPLPQERLPLVERQIPMLRLLQDQGAPAQGRLRVDQLCRAQ